MTEIQRLINDLNALETDIGSERYIDFRNVGDYLARIVNRTAQLARHIEQIEKAQEPR